MMTDFSKKAMSNRVKKDFKYTTHFLSYICFQNNHRPSFYHKTCFFFGFFGLSVPSKMSVSEIREVSFFTGRGAPENWGDQVLSLRSKGGIKSFFQIKKGGSLTFFKEIKYFVKHFRTQMEFLLILQKRCSFESVSCWNSSKRE